MKRLEKSNLRVGKFFDVYSNSVNTERTVYFVGVYGGRLIYFIIFLLDLTLRRYRVIYIQPRKEILSVHNPDWLGNSIKQVINIIHVDRKNNPGKHYLVGASLGSYLGLNISLQEHFEKFIVLAGGAPLGKVFRTTKLFSAHRKQLKKLASLAKKIPKS